MKQSIVILAAAMVGFAACSKEQVVEQPATKGIEISATVEQQIDNSTKSHLNGTSVVWNAGDEVKLFDNAGKGAKIVAQSSTVISNFEEPEPAVRDTDFDENNPTCAIYPYSAAVSCSGTTINFTLPATQTYATGSFDQGANVAVGNVSGSNISFRNVCGVLKLQLTGFKKVGKIEVISKNADDALWGSCSVDMSFGSEGPSAVVTNASSDKNKISLIMDTAVQLDKTNDTDFYIVVPKGVFSSGFDVVVYDQAGMASPVAISTVKDQTISRSTIKNMPPKVASFVPDGYSELQYVGMRCSDVVGGAGFGFNSGILAEDVDSFCYGCTASFVDVTTATTMMQICLLIDEETPLKSKSFETQEYFGTGSNSNSSSYIKGGFANATIEITPQWLLPSTSVMDGVKRDYTITNFTPVVNGDAEIFIGSWFDVYFSRSADWYYFVMCKNGVVKRDFVPCMNSASKVGYYDVVSGGFFSALNSNVNYSAGPSLDD